jgi:hypothetical protein
VFLVVLDECMDKFATCFWAYHTGLEDGTYRPRFSGYAESVYWVWTFMEGSLGIRLGWYVAARSIEPDQMLFPVGTPRTLTKLHESVSFSAVKTVKNKTKTDKIANFVNFRLPKINHKK